MNTYVNVWNATDKALSNRVDQLPGVTNMIPVTVKPDAAQGCGCDLSGPTADQFTGAYLESRGNTEEAPSGTYGLRLQLRRAQGRDWNVGSLIPKAVDDLGNREVRVKCFLNDGFQYHVLGATAHEKHDPEIKLKAGDTVKHPGGRFWVVYESRKLK
jgi:hypothetical protein